jgi:hypothetical protein
MRRMFEILVGLLFLGGAVYATKQNLRYGRDGIDAEGTVVTVMNRVEIDERSWSLTQAPVVEFMPRGTRAKRRFRSEIWTHAWFTPKSGSRLPVVYLEGEPENARIDTWQHWLLPLILAAFGIASAMGWTSWQRDRRFGFRWNDD